MLSEQLLNKLQRLKENLLKREKVLVTFSGGVDSTFLLWIAHDVLGDRVTAITAKSSTFPEREMAQARDFCTEMGIRHMVIESEELDDPEFCKNPANRCYICKQELYRKVLDTARELKVQHVIDGSNLDDMDDYRPGRKALEELGIGSPLKEANLTKEDIRVLSKEFGLSTWDKPSFACLSSRIPYGEEITREKLQMIDRAEQYLIDLGFTQVRVRHHGDMARIELSPEDNCVIFGKKLSDYIVQAFEDIGFVYTTLDLKGYRTGSMNTKLLKKQAE